MATNMDDMYKSLEDFEREVTCAICLEHYTEPKVLPCLHYYCKKCILKLALKNNPFSCPDCRKVTKVTVGKEDELPPAHFINRLEELLTKQKKALSKEVVCEICTDSHVKAEAFCKQCKNFVCAECIKSHSRMKALFEGHQIISMSEVQQLGTEELVTTTAKICKSHEKQQEIYCFRCKSLICRDCLIIDHKDHKIDFSKKVAASNRQNLMKEMEALRQVKFCLSEATREVQLTAEDIKAQGNDLERSIGASFENLQKILLERKNQLLDEVKDKVQEKTTNLKAQEKSLFTASTEVQNTLDYTQQFVKYCSDDEITIMFSDVKNQIKKEIDDPTKTGRSIEPVEEVDIGASADCSEKLQEFCTDNAKIIQVPVLVELHEEVGLVIAHVATTISVSVTLADGNQLKGDPIVQSQLKLGRSFVQQNTVKKMGHGEYSITFTPPAAGQNELLITVRNSKGINCEVSLPIHVQKLGHKNRQYH